MQSEMCLTLEPAKGSRRNSLMRAIPGPMCASHLGPDWIDPGTQARTRNYSPREMLASPTRNTVSAARDVPARLLLAAQCGLPLLPSEMRQRLAPLLSYQSMAILAGSVVAIGVAHTFGVGEIVDVIFGVVTVALLGSDAISAGRHAHAFYRAALAAQTQNDFQLAGSEFARFVTIAGIDTVIVLLSRARPEAAAPGETIEMNVEATSLRASWLTYVNRIVFSVPKDKGMLWSKLALQSESGANAMRNAERLARSKGLLTLEMLLKDEGFYEIYAKQFGSYGNIKAKGLDGITADIWRVLSARYAASLEGKVTAYILNANLRAALAAGREPVLVDELEEIANIMQSNTRISSVEMIDASSGRSWTLLRSQVLKTAQSTH